MLQDLVVGTFNDAREKSDSDSNAVMGKITSGLPLLAGFKPPF